MDNTGAGFRARMFEKTRETAPIWKRLLALIIDLLAANVLIFSRFNEILLNFFESLDITSLNDVVVPGYVYFSFVIMAILTLLYFALMQYYFRQTIGMMVLKIKVDPKPGFWNSIFRNLFILPFFPFNILWIVEPIHLYMKGHRWLEKLTQTRTIENGKK